MQSLRRRNFTQLARCQLQGNRVSSCTTPNILRFRSILFFESSPCEIATQLLQEHVTLIDHDATTAIFRCLFSQMSQIALSSTPCAVA